MAQPDRPTETKANENTDQNPKPPIDPKGERKSDLDVPPLQPEAKPDQKRKKR